MDEDRLIDIETKLAYQEKTIRDLNEVICGQQRTVEMLETRLKALSKLVDEQIRSNSGGPANEKPPHY